MGVIINIQCNIGHHCILEDFVTIQPDVHISGNNKVGEETYVGVSSTTIENLSIGKKSVIGAGSVVLNDVKPNSVYIGNPAKFFNKIDILQILILLLPLGIKSDQPLKCHDMN